MIDFLTALALMLVIEGLLYAAAPQSMRDMAVKVGAMDPTRLRWIGLAAAIVGVLELAAIRA